MVLESERPIDQSEHVQSHEMDPSWLEDEFLFDENDGFEEDEVSEDGELSDEVIEQRLAEFRTQVSDRLLDMFEAFQADHERDFVIDARQVERWIAETVGEQRSWQTGRIAPRFQRGTAIFLNSLIESVGKLETACPPSETQALGRYVTEIDRQLFGWSPNLTNYLSYADRFSVVARAQHVPLLQASLANHAVGELTYSISFDPDAASSLTATIRQQSVSERLDSLSLVEQIAIDATANGSWAERGREAMLIVLREQAKDPSLLVQLFARAALDRLSREYDQPSLGVVRYEGDPSGARLARPLNQEQLADHQELYNRVRLNTELPRGYRFQTIASDVIAAVDHGQVLHQIAFVDRGLLPEARTANQEVIEQLIESLTAQPSRINWPNLIPYINAQVVARPGEPASHAKSAAFWAQIGDGINWSQTLTDLAQLRSLQYSMAHERARLMGAAGDRNEELSRQLVLSLLRDHNLRAALPPALIPHLDQLRSALDLDDQERAFTAMEHLLLPFRLNAERPPAAIRPHLKAWERLRIQHQVSFHEAQYRYEQLIQTEEQQRAKLLAVIDQTVDQLRSDPTVLAGLLAELRERQEEDERAEVAAVDVYDLQNDARANPLGLELDRHAGLTLQRLHEPTLKGIVEESIGVKLAEVPIATQIHLLKFLLEADRTTIDRLSAITKAHPEYGVNFLKTFLTLQLDPAYGDSILKLGESINPDAGPTVFGKYAEVVDKIYEVTAYLDVELGKGAVLSGRTQRIAKHLVQYGKRMLENALKQPEATKAFRDQIETIKGQLVLVAGAVKDVRRERPGLTLDELDKLFTSIELSELKGSKLSLTEQEALLVMSDANYHDKPIDRALARQGFEKAFASEASTFHLVRNDGEIIGVVRFDRQKNGSLYMGSMNVRGELMGSSLGAALFELGTELADQGEIIEGHTGPALGAAEKDIGAPEQGSMGFVVDTIERSKVEVHGEQIEIFDFAIILDRVTNRGYESAKLPLAELRAQAVDRLPFGTAVGVVRYRATNPEDHQSYRGLMEQAAGLVNRPDGYVITRYVRDPEDSHTVYCVFERRRIAAQPLAQAA